MNRLTEDQRMSRRIGLSLLGLCLLVFLSSTARAADDYSGFSMNSLVNHATSGSPVLVCGGQIGHQGGSLQIRGSDVAALWHSAYRMLVPRAALADSSSVPEVGVNKLPYKGPTWGFNVSRSNTLITIQTKW